jgi:alanine racemase
VTVDAAVRATAVVVDLAAIRRNARRVAQRAGAAPYLVVKADAYGHGAVAVARSLAAQGVGRGFVVARPDEGLELRRHGIREPILVLGTAVAALPPVVAGELVGEMRRAGLTPGISSLAELAAWLSPGAPSGAPPQPVHLKVDTGLGRAGLTTEELRAALERIAAVPHVRLEGLYTHLAESEELSGGYTRLQLDRFDAALASLGGAGAGALRHAANSCGALHWPRSRYDAVRVGGALYGVDLSADDLRGEVETAMRVTARVTQVKTVRTGDSVGYGRRWRSDGEREVALLPIGYADGLASCAAEEAFVLLRGRRARVAGAISMDLSSVDVTGLGVQAGDEAVILGEQGQDRIGIAEHARWSRSTPYECLCRFSRRVAPTYLAADP